jgi:hypothetical protein
MNWYICSYVAKEGKCLYDGGDDHDHPHDIYDANDLCGKCRKCITYINHYEFIEKKEMEF